MDPIPELLQSREAYALTLNTYLAHFAMIGFSDDLTQEIQRMRELVRTARRER